MSALPGNVFLIGYRGTGKSTVACLLAERLAWTAVDADACLEAKHSRTIRRIFADEGEAGFRAKEAAVLAEIGEQSRQVVATGGGVILRADNRALLRRAGFVIWLTAPVETIWNRLQQDASTCERRPPLSVGGRREIEDLLQQREPLYAACADLTIDTDGHMPLAVAEIIAPHLAHLVDGG